MEFVFQLSSYDSPELEAETVRALDRLMEAHSRSVLPGVWAVTDRINQNSRYAAEWPNQQRAAKRCRFYGALMLGIGIFMLIPGLMEPRKLLVVLLGGILAILSSIAYFRRTKALACGTRLQTPRKPSQASRRAAGQLLDQLRQLDLEARALARRKYVILERIARIPPSSTTSSFLGSIRPGTSIKIPMPSSSAL